ncbi:hypothetical protein HMI56_003978 [Coelomomyces lativittatus]|nr:hypothetical protein HMI56_003978 [Coelomomyces lativittatus]
MEQEVNEEINRKRSQVHTRCAQRILDTMLFNRGVFVKMGQHVASLVYLIPLEYINTFKVLQDQCHPTPFDDIEKMFLMDLGAPWQTYFDSIETTPIGVASLGQVHRATLKDGTPVAVKLQHPTIRQFSMLDIQLTSKLVKVMKWIFPEFDLYWLANEMAINLPLELDFLHEARNAAKVKDLFSNSPLKLKIPNVFFASKRILCMEYIDGKRIDDLNYMRQHHIHPQHVGVELTRIFSKMIFEDGFVHADPHPGNLFLISKTPASKNLSFWSRYFFPRHSRNFEIVLLDHGLYQTLPTPLIQVYAQLWKRLLQKDWKHLDQWLLDSGLIQHPSDARILTGMLTGQRWSSTSPSTPPPSSSLWIHPSSTPIRDELKDIQQPPPSPISPQVKKENEALSGSMLVESTLMIHEFSKVLAHLPRPMLLIMKTNDVLRSLMLDLHLPPWTWITLMCHTVWSTCHASATNFEGNRWEAFRNWIERIGLNVLVFYLTTF